MFFRSCSSSRYVSTGKVISEDIVYCQSLDLIQHQNEDAKKLCNVLRCHMNVLLRCNIFYGCPLEDATNCSAQIQKFFSDFRTDGWRPSNKHCLDENENTELKEVHAGKLYSQTVFKLTYLITHFCIIPIVHDGQSMISRGHLHCSDFSPHLSLRIKF